LSPGRTSAITVSIPNCAAIRSAVARLSPVSMTTRTFWSCNARTAAAEVSRGASARPIDRRHLCVYRREHGGLAGVCDTVVDRPCRRQVDAEGFHQAPVTDGYPMSIDHGGGALSRDVAEVTRGACWDALRHGVRDHCRGKGVFGLSLDGGHEVQPRVGADGEDLGHLGFALGQGAGLVHHHDLGPLQRSPGPLRS